MNNFELYSLMAIVLVIIVRLYYIYIYKYLINVFNKHKNIFAQYKNIYRKEVSEITVIRYEEKKWDDVGVEVFLGFEDNKYIRRELRKHPQWVKAHTGSIAYKIRYKILGITYRTKYSTNNN